MELIEGHKDEKRAQLAKDGLLLLKGDDGRYRPFTPFRKTSLTYAVQMTLPFSVSTLEGIHTGKAGDWLAVGAHGEMYPIDDEVFKATYEPAE